MSIEVVGSLPSKKWVRNNPLNFEEKDEFLFETKKEVIIPEMSLYKIEGSNILIDEDGSVSEGLKLFEKSLRMPEEMLNHYSLFKKIKRRIKYKKKTFKSNLPIVVMSDYWSGEYYHFLVEALSRLVFYKMKFNDFVIVTTNRQMKNFHHKAFELFGIKDIIYLEPRNFLQVSQCFFSDFAGPPDIHRPELIEGINKYLSADLLKLEPTRLVYLSRQKAPKRKILNNDELESYLTTHGFEIVYAEELSFDEQRKLFNETRILITPHGAGLTNVLFMQSNSIVIEIKKDCWGKLKDGSTETTKYYNTYWHLCEILKIKYYYIKARALVDNESAHTADLNINIDELKNLLKEILK